MGATEERMKETTKKGGKKLVAKEPSGLDQLAVPGFVAGASAAVVAKTRDGERHERTR